MSAPLTLYRINLDDDSDTPDECGGYYRDSDVAARMDELRLLIQRLAHSLRKASPDNDLSGPAMDYLKRISLTGSPLRAPTQGADGESLRPVAIEAPRPSVFRSFETMCWPAPCEALGEIGHRLTYDHSDKSDRLVAASVISAYQHLMSMPAKRRDAIVSELRKGPGVIAASAPMEKT